MIALLLKTTTRELRRTAPQTAALLLVLAAAIAIHIALLRAAGDLAATRERAYAQLRFADVTFAVDSAPEALTAEIKGVDGVAAATGRLILDTGISIAGSRGREQEVRARLIGIPSGHLPEVDSLLVTTGTYFSPSLSLTGVEGRALAESQFARAYRLEPGDTVSPYIQGRKAPLRVSGIAVSPEYLVPRASSWDPAWSAGSFGVLFLPRSSLQSLTGSGRTVNNFAVLLEPGADANRVIGGIRRMLEPYGLSAVTLKRYQPSNEALSERLEGYREMGYLLPALLLLVAAGSFSVILRLRVARQQRQIAVMKALGCSRGWVLLRYLSGPLLIGLAGTVLGTVLAPLLVSAITAALAGELDLPVAGSGSPLEAAAAALLSILVAAGGGLLPGLHASRAGAAAEADASGGRHRGPRTPPAPGLWLRIPLRNLSRVPARTLATLAGVFAGFVLLFASWALIASTANLISDAFQSAGRRDLSARFNSLQSPRVVDEVRGWPGVREAEPLIELPVTARKRGSAGFAHTEQLLVSAAAPSRAPHPVRLEGGGGLPQALAGGGAVISRSTAKRLDAAAGDTLVLDTPFGPREVTVAGIAGGLFATTLHISLAEAERWIPFHATAFNALSIDVARGQEAAVESSLYRLGDVAGVESAPELRAGWQARMIRYRLLAGSMLVFGLIVIFAFSFSAARMNAYERRREFAMLRVLGAGASRITLVIAVETLVPWAIALVPGLLLGDWAARGAAGAFQSSLFNLPVTITAWSYAIPAGAALLLMAIAAIPAIRRMAELDLAAATRS